MRFSVDAHAIGRHLTGNEVYIRNLLNGFASLDRSSEFIAYVSADDAASWVPQRFTVRKVSRNPFIRLGLDLTRRLLEDRPALLHVQYTAPLVCPVPCIVSVHDVSFLEHPEFFTAARRLQLRHTVERTVRHAAKVLTPSEFSRDAILKCYNLPADRVIAIPNAVSSALRPVSRTTATNWVRDRFGIPGPYLLMVGDLQPRKNQVGLVEAFASCLRERPELKHNLVLVGKKNGYAAAVRVAAMKAGVSERVLFTGFVSDEDLLQFYGACDLFVFSSFYEGFGIPILEAMACGRAVACSDTSAMSEVADGAAILFDPYSTGSMGKAMLDLLLDAELRTRMERLGMQRASQFSWEKSAQKTLDVYYEVAGEGRQTPKSARATSISHS
jgi:glycosyltransferase involved in cell wall biosynthesis